MIVFAALVILACLLSSTPGAADERSQMLWSRGLIELQDGRYPVALERFQEAVDADPRDVHARYYRAVARARLGDHPGAIADLRFVLAAEPDFDEAALDLGVTLVEERQYAEALPWLEQARRSPPLATRASLFIGIAQLRDNQLAAAKESFARVVDDPEHGVTARYYAGVVDYQIGNLAEAKAAFTVVAQAQPNTPVGREAQRFLELLESPSGRWYSLTAAVGLNYDSNVILAPAVGGGDAQNVLGVSQQSDGEGVIRAGALLVPWQRGATVSLAYDFYQSYHFELVEFDLQAHTVSTQVSSEVGAVRFGVLGRYDYSLLDTQSFVQVATGSPWVTVPTGDFGRFALFYRVLWSDYKQIAFSVRNSFNHAVGATQVIELGRPDRGLVLGYQYDVEDPDVDQKLVDANDFTAEDAEGYGYHGNEVSVGGFWLLPLSVQLETRFAYRYEYYAPESAAAPGATGGRRRDNDFLFYLSLRRRIWEGIDGVVGYFGDFNDSNNTDFDYDRSIVSVAVEARY